MSAGQETRHKNVFERTVEGLGTGLGNSIGWLAQRGVLFVLYAAIWAAVGAGLLLSESTVSQAWAFMGSQNLIAQAVLWLLFLPVIVGLWIWHTDWPVLLRALLVVALAGWNLLVFLPRRSGQPSRPAYDGEEATGG